MICPSVSLSLLCVFLFVCLNEKGEKGSHVTLCVSAAGLLLAVGTTTNLIRNSP